MVGKDNLIVDTKPKLSAGELLICGGIAGMTGKTIMAPIDRVRILYQVNPSRNYTLVKGLKTMRTIFAQTGFSGLWRGNMMALTRVLPHSAIVFMAFDRAERAIFQATNTERNMYSRFFAGAIAGVTATSITYPLDLIRARMAAHWNKSPPYKSHVEAFKSIVKNEGPLALFRGLRPTLYGVIPYGGISFAVFETMKAFLTKHTSDNNVLSQTTITLGSGATAGLLAQTLTYPLHVVRRRMQVSTENSYQSTWSALRQIYIREGLVGGLLKGVSISWIKGPISVGMSFAVNDFLKYKFAEMQAEPKLEVHTDNPVPTGPAEIGQLSSIEFLIAGGIAGACAKTIIAPGDRIKILYQIHPDWKFSLRSALKSGSDIVKMQGIRGLWQGNGATMMRVMPYAGLTYLTFERYHSWVAKTLQKEKDVFTRLFAGAAAGATATSLTYPLDLMRARMAAHWGSSPKYPSYAEAFNIIVKEEGYGSLFRGLRPTLIGIVPYAGLSFATFETIKANFSRSQGINEKEVPTHFRLFAGCVAGLVAQSATYPLDIVRRRMQVHHPVDKDSHKLRTFLKMIFNKEGWRGLYKGLSMNWVKGPIAVSVSFTVNDLLKQKLLEQKRL